MILNFTKMHGTGNDYVYINLFEENVDNPAEVAKMVSNRHFGIGSDGLILIAPSAVADCRMIMYNADGSEGAMCGNGVRCVAKYAYDHGIAKKDTITVETKSGIKTLEMTVENEKAVYARVDMGKAILAPEQIPVKAEGENFVAQPLIVDGKEYKVTCVSMGNPHCVIFTEGIDGLDLEKIGPSFENHPMFPDRINTEFVDSICNTGKIDQTMYWQFISEVSAASGIYQVKIMHEQKELLLSEEQYSYVSTFYDEEDILSCLMAGEDYVLHRGDYVKVLLLREKSRGTQPFMNSFPWLADSTGNVFYGGTVRYEAF